MNNPQPRPKNQRSRRRRTNKPAGDLWRNGAEPAVPEPIVPTPEPAALLNSLGPPPLQDRSNITAQYLAAVIDRAAMLASALASSAGLLAETSDE
jgi:hypothetical protein